MSHTSLSGPGFVWPFIQPGEGVKSSKLTCVRERYRQSFVTFGPTVN
jgi:hypothetical protein